MKVIGITGGIAAGKSTVTEYLLKKGETVIDADNISKDLAYAGSPVLKDIESVFGKQFIDKDGSLKRKELGEYIFKDEKKVAQLNQIFHPRVWISLRQQIRDYEAKEKERIFLDVPLLYETGMDILCHQVWLVYLDPKTQLERLMLRNNMTEEIALNRIRAQMSLDEKKKLATRIIDNSGSMEETYLQIEGLLNELQG